MADSLDAADVARLTRALEGISGLTDPEVFPRAAVEAACMVVPCEVATYNEVAPKEGTRVAWFPEDLPPPPDVEAILQRYAYEHPLINEIQRTGDGSPRAISDFLTLEQFRRLNLFKLLFEPIGLEDQLAIGLPAPRPLIIGIALSRARRGFDGRDRLLANLIRPYLVQAHRATRLAASLEASTALGLDDRAGVLVRVGGRVQPLRDRFPAWLPEDELFPGGRLDEEARAWLSRQRGEDRRSEALPPLSRLLVRSSRSGRWMFRHVEISSGSVIVVTRGWETARPVLPALRALGLTDRQATVLDHVTRGASNPEIAKRLGVSVSTVKRHLEAIYRKLGVRGRAEAAALAVDTIAHG